MGVAMPFRRVLFALGVAGSVLAAGVAAEAAAGRKSPASARRIVVFTRL